MGGLPFGVTRIRCAYEVSELSEEITQVRIAMMLPVS